MDINTVILWNWIIVIKGCVLATLSPFFFTPESGWWDGLNLCERHLGKMLTIETETKYDFFMEIDRHFYNNFILNNEINIGLSTTSRNCTGYVWANAEPYNLSKWSTIKPKDCASNQCVFLKNWKFEAGSCLKKRVAACDYGEFLYDYNLFISWDVLHWLDAYSVCSRIGGRLVIINDAKKQEQITLQMRNYSRNSLLNGRYWIGLVSLTTSCDNLTWVDGTAANWTNFVRTPKCETTPFVVLDSIDNEWLTEISDKKYVAVCEPDSSHTENFFHGEETMTRDDAADWCRQNKATLATVEYAKQYIQALAVPLRENGYISAWIGLVAHSNDCSLYVWANKPSRGLVYWSFGEPDKCSTDHCVVLKGDGLYTEACQQYETVALCAKESLNYSVSVWQLAKLATANEKAVNTSEKPTTTNEKLATANEEVVNTSEKPTTTNEKLATANEEVATTYDRPSTTYEKPETTSLQFATTTAKPTTTNERLSNTSEKPTTTDSITTDVSCACCTRVRTNVTKPTHTELLEVMTQIKAELSVNKSITSTYRRKRVSVYESRPSSMVMGGVACIIMSIAIGWLVVPDLITLFLFLFKCASRRRINA